MSLRNYEREIYAPNHIVLALFRLRTWMQVFVMVAKVKVVTGGLVARVTGVGGQQEAAGDKDE